MQFWVGRWNGAALAVSMAIVLALAGCSPTRPVGTRDGGEDGGAIELPDADGDGIGDEWEGARDGVDTDGDGTPDYQDSDSDGDGIPDSVEGNTNRTTGEPADSDGDGTYDFRDLDSDDNGILDADELDDDIDGDGDPAFRDLDDDGDFIEDRVELGGNPAAPVDTDGDGAPDFQDVDSDNDTIADLHEAVADTDMDGIPDRFDSDSDGDGILDSAEAGDADFRTPPIDTDSDLIPDFRDTDSDGDGIGDTDEVALGTDPRRADTDGDGVSDLVEIAACPPGDASCAGDATNPASSPRSRGDFVFFEPYMMPPLPARDTLDFATDLRVADVYFLMDTTGSMGGAISSLQAGLSTPGSGIIDRVRTVIPDVWFGVGGFDDYLVGGYGYADSCDRAYYNLQDITASTTTAQAAVNRLATHFGGDGPESMFPALYSVASGLGLPGESGWNFTRSTGGDPGPIWSGCPDFPPYGACPAGHRGWPCFRPGAVPIVVAITDIDSHNGPGDAHLYTAAGSTDAPRYPATVAALNAANVRVIGIAVYGGGRAHLEQVARDTGALDAAGRPLVTDWSGGAISDEVVGQIQTLANQTPLDISVEYLDDPADGVDSWTAFVDHIEANTAGDPARGCAARGAEDTNSDGHADTFRDVTPGNRVCFDIVVRQNDTVMPTTEPQIFRATLRVLGDGFTELDRRDVFFLVPGTVRGPGIPE
jgi:hypothetical protein